MVIAGANPEIEEGGGAYKESGDWCGARRPQLSVRALASFPDLRAIVACQYVAQKHERGYVYRTCTVL